MKSHEGSFIHHLEVTDQFGADAEWTVKVHYEYEEPDPSVGMQAQWKINYVSAVDGYEEPDVDFDDLPPHHQTALVYAFESYLDEKARMEDDREAAMAEDAADARAEMRREQAIARAG